MGSETDSGASRLRMCLTRGVPSRVPDSVVRVQSPPRLPRAAVALCLLSVLPYVGMVIAEPEYVARQGAETVSRAVVLSALATLQIAAVMMTARFPYWVLGIGQHQADVGQHAEQAEPHRGPGKTRWSLHLNGGIGHASSQADARRRGVRLRLRTHHL